MIDNPTTDEAASGPAKSDAGGSPKDRRQPKPKPAPRKPGPYTPKPAATRKDCPPEPPTTPPQIDVALPPFFYDKDKGCYWRHTPSAEYVRVKEDDLKRHLRFAGVRVGDVELMPGLTKFDAAIVRCQNEAAVDNVICLAGHRAGIFATEDKRNILIPKSPSFAASQPGKIENWQGFLEELFPDQVEHVLSWLKCALEDAHSLNPAHWRHHQLLALVGKPDCGKSFFQLLLTQLLGGREADSYLWMAGKSDFNEDLAEAEHWKMEDKNAFRDAKSRAAFGGMIKQVCVSHNLSIHGKGKKQILLPSYRRLTLSINDDPEYITILPMLDSSVADKIMIVKCAKATMLPDFAANRARFIVELPHFVHFLLHVWRIPKELENVRYGVKTWHAPEVVEMLQQFEPHLRLLEVLDSSLFGDAGPHAAWQGTSTELHKTLCNGAYESIARQLMTNPSACGQLLSKLMNAQPDRVRFSLPQGVRKWTIQPPR